MANLDWKSKTKGAEIDNLMEALGYLSDTGTRRHSKYIASYKKQLLGTVNKTVTGFYTEQWRVTLNFSQKEFNDWDRIGFEFAIPYKYGQHCKFLDEYDEQGDRKTVIYQIDLLKSRRRL